MSTLGSQFTGAAGQVKTDTAGRMEIGWNRPLPGGAPHAARARPTQARSVALALVLVCLLALLPLAPTEAIPSPALAVAPDAPGDEYWASGLNLLGMSDTVRALAVGPDGSLYVGGDFTTAGAVAANYIARWDGSQWHPLGSGMGSGGPYYGPSVYALAFGPDGSLYAGGGFTTAGGVAANRIARWDGSQWHPLGNGMEGTWSPHVYALAFGPDGSLYAGGVFWTAGGAPAKDIARWDGSQWHPLGSGSGMGDPEYPFVYALVFGPDGSLYAGGKFTTAGGVAAYRIARWDGATSSWHPLGSGMDRSVEALAFGPDGSLYAAGEFITAGGVAANHIARWDGSQWHSLGSGMGAGDPYFGATVTALAFGPDGSLYAGGKFTAAGGVAANYIARWDGSQWHPLGNGLGDGVFALAFGLDGSLYAGGIFTTAGGVAAKDIARWDGATSSWHPLGSGSGMNHFVTALAIGPDGSLYSGGWFTTAGAAAANYIARWDGSQWHPLGSGMGYGVFALAFGPDGSLYAGGDFTTAGGVAANYVARWDGSQWHPLGSGMGSGGTDYGPSVSALAFGPDGSLYAGGDFTTAGGVAANYIARWDGSQWHPLGSGMGGGGGPYFSPSVRVLAFGPDNSLYAGGYFTTAGGEAANSIARWDGSQWHPLASGISGGGWSTVFDLAVGPDSSLYVGGDFTTAGGVAANYIARWDGSQWYPLGSGMPGVGYSSVSALAFGPDGSLYAGGYFATAGGVAGKHIARWDGAQWHPLGSGMNDSVSTLAFGPDGSLYAGGGFRMAGGKLSSHIALWTGAAQRPVVWFSTVLIDQ